MNLAKKVTLVLGLTLLPTCSDDAIQGSIARNCSTLSGTYTITSYLCDGVESSSITSVFEFTSSTSATLTQGFDACSQVLTWDISATEDSISLTGRGNLACLASGSSTSSCSSGSVVCTDSASIDGTANAYEVCEYDGDNIKISRTATAAQVSAAVTNCSAGESEVVTLTPDS